MAAGHAGNGEGVSREMKSVHQPSNFVKHFRENESLAPDSPVARLDFRSITKMKSIDPHDGTVNFGLADVIDTTEKDNNVQEGGYKDVQNTSQFELNVLQTPAKIGAYEGGSDAKIRNSIRFHVPGIPLRQVDSTEGKFILVKSDDRNTQAVNNDTDTPYAYYQLNPIYQDSFMNVLQKDQDSENPVSQVDKLSPTFGKDGKSSRDTESPLKLSPVPNLIHTERSPFIPSPRRFNPQTQLIDSPIYNIADQKKNRPHLPRDKIRLFKWIDDKELQRDMMYRKLMELDHELELAKRSVTLDSNGKNSKIKMFNHHPIADINKSNGYDRPWLKYKLDKKTPQIKKNVSIHKDVLNKFVNPSLRESQELNEDYIAHEHPEAVQGYDELGALTPAQLSNHNSQTKASADLINTIGNIAVKYGILLII